MTKHPLERGCETTLETSTLQEMWLVIVPKAYSKMQQSSGTLGSGEFQDMRVRDTPGALAPT